MSERDLTEEEAREKYSILQEYIINQLRVRSWFINCIAHNFDIIGEEWDSAPTISSRRLGEAHDFWTVDATRTLNEGMPEGTKELDHFKHASFIAFWLRRQIPINETMRLQADKQVDGPPLSSEQEFFFRYGNEICALIIGFQICLYYELVGESDRYGKIESIVENRTEYVKKCKLDRNLIREYAMIMKHKNMSPHAMYLLYKSLFSNLRAPPEMADGKKRSIESK